MDLYCDANLDVVHSYSTEFVVYSGDELGIAGGLCSNEHRYLYAMCWIFLALSHWQVENGFGGRYAKNRPAEKNTSGIKKFRQTYSLPEFLLRGPGAKR